ncbi:unnamed protein product [Dovyalis caffra]|uniref:Fibronectin type III-like domain-containing protein n=1 Tax=Dovyalis caffra TaxID=77055 RepID=A0AAV1RRR7_9ROSI|nr:unnamed protein product [Dovyalis caffra]
MAKVISLLLYISLFLSCFVISGYAKRKVSSNRNYKIQFVDDATPTGSNFTFICDPSRTDSTGLDISSFNFCDKTLSYRVRAKDLVARMTLKEKVAQLGNNATGVPRLGLPFYGWWSEGLHGLSNVGPGTFFDGLVPSATSFPTVILSTASFNESLWRKLGQAVSDEARAMYNLGRGGLTLWSPVINVARDPRWGRILETPGEDPFVVGRFAANYVRGLQDIPGTEKVKYEDPNSRPIKVSACCKHFTAYDVDNWHGVERISYDAKVPEQDLVETFNLPFEMCVKEGDASSIMCSYNRVNGIPACADPNLLSKIVREQWDLHGYIVADCDSVQVMVDNHKWLNVTKEEAVAKSLKAGKQGKVNVKDIDNALENLYVVLMRLGYFDGSPTFKRLGKKDVCSKQHIELATEAAREGIVLLKNENGTLPLNPSNFKTLALVGPHSKAREVMIGNYAFDGRHVGKPCQYTTPFDAFSTYGKVINALGCDVHCKDESLIFPAMEAAKNADATIMFVGLDLTVEAESLDRNDLLLPGSQTKFINQVADVAKGPVILVIMSAGGVDINFAKNNPKIKAILWAGYPGEEGGRAIADVVYGKYNPGGRLPITWYQADYINNFPMTSMQLRPDVNQKYPGRTYKFFNGSTVFPFGYGLSYTKFDYKLASTKNIVTVQNVDSRDGSEVVMVYSKPPAGVDGTHLKQLIGFQKVFVPTGGSKSVTFAFNACKSLGIVDYAGIRLLPSGGHTIMVGDGAISFPVQVNYS